MSAFVKLITVTLAALAAMVGALRWAPAGVADWGLSRVTEGRLRLANVDGTLWSGSGRLVIVDNAEAEPGAVRAIAQGLMIPGGLSWQINPWPLMLGLIDVDLRLEGMPRPLHLGGRFDSLRGSAAQLALPALELGRLGSPWNTIRPSAAISVQWDEFTLRRGRFEGMMRFELREVASAMTPVRPLGSYRAEVVNSGQSATVTLSTLEGPLSLRGNGQWEARQGLRFVAEAEASGAERDKLQVFLALIGRKEGEKTIIKIGA